MQITFIGALTLLFIGLRLGNVILWSWWWVLSPLWISFLVFFVIGLFAERDRQRGLRRYYMGRPER